MTDVIVTQEDREAAAAMQRWKAHDKFTKAEEAILDGMFDELYSVQAFASHRIKAALAMQERAWPVTLTPDLRDILGMMCFEFISLSQVYRAAGHDIPKRAEDEQAYFLHKLLGFWFAHGPEWRKAAGEELRAIRNLEVPE